MLIFGSTLALIIRIRDLPYHDSIYLNVLLFVCFTSVAAAVSPF